MMSNTRRSLAEHLVPGDLVFSPRTKRTMLILSVVAIKNFAKEKEVRISWLDANEGSPPRRLESIVNSGNIYYKIVDAIQEDKKTPTW